jgi:hypothetical protein
VLDRIEGLRREFLSVRDISDSAGPSARRADRLIPDRRDKKAASRIARAGTGITPVHPSWTVHGQVTNDTYLRTPCVLDTDDRAAILLPVPVIRGTRAVLQNCHLFLTADLQQMMQNQPLALLETALPLLAALTLWPPSVYETAPAVLRFKYAAN